MSRLTESEMSENLVAGNKISRRDVYFIWDDASDGIPMRLYRDGRPVTPDPEHHIRGTAVLRSDPRIRRILGPRPRMELSRPTFGQNHGVPGKEPEEPGENPPLQPDEMNNIQPARVLRNAKQEKKSGQPGYRRRPGKVERKQWRRPPTATKLIGRN